MTEHINILDQPEPLRKPLVASIGLHLGLVGFVTVLSLLHMRKAADWGSPNAGGVSVGINVVKSIPLPSRPGVVNPLASNSNTTVPLPPPQAKPQPRAKEPAADAIPLKSRNAEKKRASEPASPKTTYRAPGQDKPNQVYSTTGPALVSPLVGQTGAGGVGVGQGSALGNRFGWYIDLLRGKVAEHWRPDPQQQSTQAAIVTFMLQKDGSVRDVKITQRSGNTVLDYAAQRSILDAAPFQPMPDGAGDSAHIEFWFNVRR
jgi:TonB family protein